MSQLKAQARPRSIDTLRLIATTTKDLLGYEGEAEVPVERVLEFGMQTALPGFVYDILPFNEMGGNHGLAAPDHDYIALREDVYEGALRGAGVHRFTISHEIGHLILHQQNNLMQRRGLGRSARWTCPEWQADTFAAEFLMDHRYIRQTDTAPDLCNRFGVTMSAAKTRLYMLNKTNFFHERKRAEEIARPSP